MPYYRLATSPTALIPRNLFLVRSLDKVTPGWRTLARYPAEGRHRYAHVAHGLAYGSRIIVALAGK